MKYASTLGKIDRVCAALEAQPGSQPPPRLPAAGGSRALGQPACPNLRQASRGPRAGRGTAAWRGT